MIELGEIAGAAKAPIITNNSTVVVEVFFIATIKFLYGFFDHREPLTQLPDVDQREAHLYIGRSVMCCVMCAMTNLPMCGSASLWSIPGSCLSSMRKRSCSGLEQNIFILLFYREQSSSSQRK